MGPFFFSTGYRAVMVDARGSGVVRLGRHARGAALRRHLLRGV